MIQAGQPKPKGAVCDADGVNFALYSAAASAVELCLFDENHAETARYHLPRQTDGVWHGYLPGCRAGQRYGYRVHGTWSPTEGLRFNPAKLVLDPYARRLDGRFFWSPAVFDFEFGTGADIWRKSELDSAAFVPRCVVTDASSPLSFNRPHIPWPETIIYETNVRGFTMRHPLLSPAERGSFRGLSNGRILEYIKSLGITSVELMPVQACIDEAFLVKRGLRNYWAYNSFQFFVPDSRFACVDAVAEFREMVHAIHEAGLEVILDVAYNHTGESDERGPTLSFRGIDNLCYYRSQSDHPGQLANDTGCGNTINADHPVVQDLVVDSLTYWHQDLGVDGFRFDLGTVLGRTDRGFDPAHDLLRRITHHPALRQAKLIAEPWDAGADGYQLGHFPPSWAEWNDRYRDTVRRYWRGDAHQLGEFARRIHGSADLFERNGRQPACSINFITCHDGFTLQDLVSYRHRHNQANGQENQDGHRHNYSCNHGIEGPSDDKHVTQARFQHRLNLLATLLFSQGTPMLLAGDEFGHSQNGNNNAYAQDNETSWLDWRQLQSNQEFFNQVRNLIGLRRELPLLRLPRYVHGSNSAGFDIQWLKPNGKIMQPADWEAAQQLTLMLSKGGESPETRTSKQAVAILFNAAPRKTRFSLPRMVSETHWNVRFCSSTSPPRAYNPECWQLDGESLALMSIT